MNRRQRRSKVQQPYEEPWWKWAGVPNFFAMERFRAPSRKAQRDNLRAVSIAAGIAVLGVTSLFVLAWLVRQL